MIKLNKYRHLPAVFLFVLYAFVATPVQLWHSDAKRVSSRTDTYSTIGMHSMLSGSNSEQVEDNCLVCAHHYSMYNHDAIILNASVFQIQASQHGFYVRSISSSPSLDFSNRGPPTQL